MYGCVELGGDCDDGVVLVQGVDVMRFCIGRLMFKTTVKKLSH